MQIKLKTTIGYAGKSILPFYLPFKKKSLANRKIEDKAGFEIFVNVIRFNPLKEMKR